MKETIVLYNPLSGNGRGEAEAKALSGRMSGTALSFRDITKIGDYAAFFASLSPDVPVILCGGDGTINRFVNDTDGIPYENEILYFATGSGNDFLHDLGKEPGCDPFPIGKYLKDLPLVDVNGKTYRVLNGVGYGIDGYCCEVGDKQRETSSKPVNYAGIAIKGLLFHFKPVNAVVTVDGKPHSFRKVWIAPTMNGRFYGGGMNAAPSQDRLNSARTVTNIVMFGKGRLHTLAVFPSIFKGEHVRHENMVSVLSGKEITVAFDRPTALQIDGETILNVSEYSVRSSVLAGAKV